MAIDLQNVVVTLVALAAAALFVRRLIGAKSGGTKPSCPSCDAGTPCAPATDTTGVQPLMLVRSKAAKVDTRQS